MKTHLNVAIAAAFVIVALQIVVGAIGYFLLPDWPTRGQFGDLFGAVNALFSGFAFAGLIYAILLQREDLSLQRTELELTRQELQRSASAQEQSEIALRAQAEATARSASLAATNFLLAHYQHELAEMRKVAYPGNDPRLARFRELERRESILLARLDSLFQQLAIESEATNAAQDR